MMAMPLLFGLVVGSFLNVVIVRIPEGKSLWAPRSACPRCGTLIAWYDNIPILSFVALRGRCRGCRMSIPWRYPLVEIATGAAFTLAYALFGPTIRFVAAALLLAGLIAITAIDLRHQIIPDLITLPGLAAGFVLSLATGHVTWLDSLIGIAVCGGIFLAMILIRPGGMGSGDVKLGAMLGAFLGWKLGLLALYLGVLAGGSVAICLLALGRKGRKDPIPFGPFLALGGAVSLLWGNQVLAWYLGRF